MDVSSPKSPEGPLLGWILEVVCRSGSSSGDTGGEGEIDAWGWWWCCGCEESIGSVIPGIVIVGVNV